MPFQNKKIAILYGSQTGNAQDIAERIWRESKRLYFVGNCVSMDDYDIANLINEECVIFVCSTTGQGEEPDNMKRFWKFLLRRSLPVNALAHIKFAVLGLGDSSYIKFNFAAKRLNKRLAQLGGQSLIPIGLGDDQHDLGYDAAVDPWINLLFGKLLEVFPLPQGVKPLEKNSVILPRWNVTCSLPQVSSNSNNSSSSLYYSTRKPEEFFVTVKENIRTTNPSHFQDVRLIKFQTNGEKYSPGDVLVLRPKNIPSQVEQFKTVLSTNGVNIPPETLVNLSETTKEISLPPIFKNSCTFQQLCEEYFDLTAIPRRYVFSILSQITDSELEKEKCTEFTLAEGQEELYSYVNRPRRNIVEVLQDFPHATKNLSLEMLFEILTPIRPREFSIASSFRDSPDEIHILVAVVKYKTKLVKERLGLCSNYLADLKNGDKINVWLKSGSFKFPRDNQNNPVIMIGPGTGVAPFRSYILERAQDKFCGKQGTVLFFGCRGKDLDFHCKEEFLKLEKDGRLCLVCAFSREQDYKIYVQHKIREKSSLVWELLKNRNCCVFVAGNSKFMPQEVREAFVSVCVNEGKMTSDEAENFIETMEKTGRYQIECWS